VRSCSNLVITQTTIQEAEKAYAAAAAQYAEQQAPADAKEKRKAEEELPVTENSGGKKRRLGKSSIAVIALRLC